MKICALFLGCLAACAASIECDDDGASRPPECYDSGGHETLDCSMVGSCWFTAPVDFNGLTFASGENFGYDCITIGTDQSPDDDCVAICEKMAVDEGGASPGACAHVRTAYDVAAGEGVGHCKSAHIACNQSDYPQFDHDPGEPPYQAPTINCGSLTASDHMYHGSWKPEQGGAMHSADNMPPCGYPVALSPADADHDTLCHDFCVNDRRFAFAESDALSEEQAAEIMDNCDTFAELHLCNSAPPPQSSTAYIWNIGGRATPAALLCGVDHPCCAAYGAAACDNLRVSKVKRPAAATSGVLTMTATLTGAGTTAATLTGSVKYSLKPCNAANGTCPVYIEALNARQQGPTRGRYSASGLSLALTRPLITAYRADIGELRFPPRALPLQVAGETGVISIHQAAANQGTITGSVQNGKLRSLLGTIQLGGGLVLTINGSVN